MLSSFKEHFLCLSTVCNISSRLKLLFHHLLLYLGYVEKKLSHLIVFSTSECNIYCKAYLFFFSFWFLVLLRKITKNEREEMKTWIWWTVYIYINNLFKDIKYIILYNSMCLRYYIYTHTYMILYTKHSENHPNAKTKWKKEECQWP